MRNRHIREWIHRFRLERLRPLRIRLAGRARAEATGCFIGVTGSSAKSTTTALIAAVLRERGSVLLQVMDNTINPLIRTIRGSRNADFVVVEAGVGGKGQMTKMASLLRPDIAVVTLVGLEHYSAFRSKEAIAYEKGALVEATAADGFVVLNADDPHVMGMGARTNARVVTYGHAEASDYRILDVRGGFPDGIRVLLSWGEEQLEIPTQFVGEHFAGPVSAAAAVGLELGVSAQDVRKAIASQQPIHMRLSVHNIPGGPIMIADCAKAPKETLQLAFNTLKDIDAPRRRIVLGSISDYKGDRKRAYRQAVEAAFEVADEVILIAESPLRANIAREATAEGRYHWFSTTREAADHVARTAIKGEVILLKGSANFHLDRILLNLTTEVRCWENTCKRGESCFKCGLFAHEFETHSRIRRRQRWSHILHGGSKRDPEMQQLDAP